MTFQKMLKTLEESRFCYAKEGGQGFVHNYACVCTKDNPCQSMVDKIRFNEAFKDTDKRNRDEIIKEIKPQFKDSQWWKNNVIE